MSGIAIFDSGVGGLSIYQEIKHKLPEVQYVFVSDNQAFPYGTKPEHELKERVLEVVTRIVDQFDPDLLVIACNTASTVVLPLLREQFDLPIVGVVPAIKPAAKLTQTNVIGLLATPATIERDYTKQLINDFAGNCEVINVGSSRLVEIAEDKLYGQEVSLQEIKAEIKPFLESKSMDVLILACTHFPLLSNEISGLFNKENNVVLIDSAKGIANRVSQLMSKIDLQPAKVESSTAVFTKLNFKELDSVDQQFEQQLNAMGYSKLCLLK